MSDINILPELSPEQMLVNQNLHRLDEVSRRMESKWGVDRLPRCVPEDLAGKWNRQWEKLNAAIMDLRHAETVDLAQGCVRAWEALERAAMGAGYQPDIGIAMEARMPSGAILRVCSSLIDARKPVPEGYVVYAMDEVARLLEPKQLVNVIKANIDQEVIGEGDSRVKFPKEFWEGGGDAIPF